ncbi:MAG: esterase [Micrococcales bacterium]|nr:MAG: esterase [Micrococcales bacterium]PIE27944.1 MAG: esterase [Micrococcales bacterium]
MSTPPSPAAQAPPLADPRPTTSFSAAAQPYAHDAGIGAPRVLLCHGFTGSPQSLRGWGEHLAGAGCTVRIPRLPGHASTWQRLERTGWQDWYAAAERTLLDLAGPAREPVVVGGLSMGGTLALRLAVERPGLVAGLMLVNPAVRLSDPRLKLLPMLKRFTRTMPGIADSIADASVHEEGYDRVPLAALESSMRMYREIQRRLPEVHAPMLLMHSDIDPVVPADNAELIRHRVSCARIDDVPLHRSLHVATLDFDAGLIHEHCVRFIAQLHRSEATGAAVD